MQPFQSPRTEHLPLVALTWDPLSPVLCFALGVPGPVIHGRSGLEHAALAPARNSCSGSGPACSNGLESKPGTVGTIREKNVFMSLPADVCSLTSRSGKYWKSPVNTEKHVSHGRDNWSSGAARDFPWFQCFYSMTNNMYDSRRETVLRNRYSTLIW